jgi:hypothetical protein
MKLYCDNYFSKEHEKINLSQSISCCLGLLLEKYDESELYSYQKSYAGFFLRTINHYLKMIDYNISNENSLFEQESEINILLLGKLINIITHYSIIFINHNKNDFAKLICSVGIDLINFSKYKYEKNIIKKKTFLLNNLSCIYISEKRFYKSTIFLDRCVEINKTSLDNIITYNNYCIAFIKKIKENYKKIEKEEIKKIIDNIIYYSHLELKELKKRFINKYKDALKLNNEEIKDNKRKEKENCLTKKECTCFLFFNCFYIMKIFDNEEFIKNYNNGLKIIEKLLGKQHYITLKMLRINKNNNKLSIENIFMNEGKTNILNDNSFEKI